jgi:hypothetical protein
MADPLHDIIDVFSEDIERFGIDVGVSDEGAEIDCAL